jgi:hypothetical protein
MTNKVQVKAWIHDDVQLKLRQLINQKYSKYEKGCLSYEVEQAIRHWLALHTKAQTIIEVNKPNPTPKVYMMFAEVKDYLLRTWYGELNSGQQIPRIHIENAIANIRGSDKRTIEKWFRIFHKNGLIKPVTSASWEIM